MLFCHFLDFSSIISFNLKEKTRKLLSEIHTLCRADITVTSILTVIYLKRSKSSKVDLYLKKALSYGF